MYYKSIFKVIVFTIGIWTTLQSEEMPEPSKEMWLEISKVFFEKTDFPNCVGAVDRKHIRCRNPDNSGSLFFNYKKYFSLILMAVVDANLCFTSIDVGAYGKEGDSNLFKDCPIGKKLYAKQLNLPYPACLPNADDLPQPFVFIGDDDFALHSNLLRPYPRRSLNYTRRFFNYRLSRARRTVECAFGVLSNKWRVLHTPIQVLPDFTDSIVKACSMLHNFVRRRDGCNYQDTEINYLDDIEIRGTGARSQGTDVRDLFANYFVGPGSLPFQNQNI